MCLLDKSPFINVNRHVHNTAITGTQNLLYIYNNDIALRFQARSNFQIQEAKCLFYELKSVILTSVHDAFSLPMLLISCKS